MLSTDSHVTAADVFTMLDTDSTDAVTVGAISKILGHDMRDRSKLQNLFPDLQRLFLLSGGDPEHPEQVVVCAEHWNTYWDGIDSDLRTRKLTELRQLIDQRSNSAGHRAAGGELRPIQFVQTRHEVARASVCARSILQRTTVNIADIEAAGPEVRAGLSLVHIALSLCYRCHHHSVATTTVTSTLSSSLQCAIYHSIN